LGVGKSLRFLNDKKNAKLLIADKTRASARRISRRMPSYDQQVRQ